MRVRNTALFMLAVAEEQLSSFSAFRASEIVRPVRIQRRPVRALVSLGFRMPVTTAVVLGGGLGRRFGVLTSRDSPKALLPVANAPLLSYPIDWVAASGLQEALIVAGAHAYVTASACVSPDAASSWRRSCVRDIAVGERGLQRPVQADRHRCAYARAPRL